MEHEHIFDRQCLRAILCRTIRHQRAPLQLKLSIIMAASSSRYLPPKNQPAEDVSPLGFCDAEVPGGTHICMFYQSDNERHSLIVKFLHAGILGQNKCYYLLGDHEHIDVISSLKKSGVDISDVVDRGLLNIFQSSTFYHPEGELLPDNIIDRAHASALKDKEQGYSMIRITGELSREYYQKERDYDKLIEYEDKLNGCYFAHQPAVAICQYDLRRFSDNFIDEVLRTHPFFIYKGEFRRNPLFTTS